MQSRINGFHLAIIPPLWTYTAGLVLTPLVTALGSANPALAASALQTVVFVGSVTFAGYVMSKAAGSQQPVQDLTRRDWQAAREKVTQEEREAYQYQALARPGNLALGVANGKRTQVFHFPAGITLDHLTAFGDLIASGQPPRYRNLKATFDHALWSEFRDWLMIAEVNKFAVMAEYTGGRDEWDCTRAGRQAAIIWRNHSPIPLMSKDVKCRITLERNN